MEYNQSIMHDFIFYKKFEGIEHRKKPNPKIPFKFVEDKKIPPNDRSILLIWEEDWGYQVMESFLAHQHINDDIKRLGYPRIKAWLFLQKEKGVQDDERKKNRTKTRSETTKRKRRKVSEKNKKIS